MKKRNVRIITTVLVIAILAAMLLNITADALGKSPAAAYIKQLQSVDTNYESFIDSSVMHKLPSTVRDDDEISVIIMLSDRALIDTYDKSGNESFLEYSLSDEAAALREKVGKEKSKVLDRLDEMGIDYKTGAEYSTVLAGYEVVIEARYFDEVCAVIGSDAKAIVGEVYKRADTQLVENDVDVYETGIFDSSDFIIGGKHFDGEGMVVAVLDTGLDYTHDAFDAARLEGKELGLTIDEVAAVLGSTNAAGLVSGLISGDVYVSDKVPFAFDYADYDSDVYSIHNNHGTHVSGVIAGDDDVITGVAPKAQIVSMKIFSDTYDSAKTAWILSAVEDAVTLGVDVINMSIGTACGFSRETDDEIISGVYQKIRDKGISLVVAASNSFSSAYGSEKNGNLGLTSNPDTGTVGSPSTYEAAMSIASINGTKTPYILYNNRIIYFNEATDSASEEKSFFNDILPEGVNSMELEYVLVPGIGRPADYTDVDVKGKVALVRRGTTTFEQKANAAQNAGAAGIIVYNNTSGDIRMNAGITKIPICSISQDDGTLLAEAKRGTILISRTQTSGPFMSDFSSWGPTPDLKIKPEITAHGGNILSAVTGNEYDRLSGTSMACPNMAGVIALLRQYVLEMYPADEITLPNGEFDYEEVNSVINRLLMSTADIIYNKNGLPYAVRKQGAGLANLNASALTSAYILTYDKGVTDFTRGSSMNKTKVELGDDPDKNGVYSFTFSVYNFGNTELSYDISAIVMSEGVSDTPTHQGDTVVTEEGYLLSGASLTIDSVSGGKREGNRITVGGGKTVDVTVTITLSDGDKRYLDESFENGMYVEGFIKLDAVSGTDIDLSTPYLAFYGDWNKAPLFDLDYYDTNEDELDDSIELLDKTLPDAYATRPIGGLESDYINYLGSYYFLQNPEDKIISASRDYIAISNTEGAVTSLRFVWAGLLRSAERIVITITEDSTGEVVFERVENDIRKSYGDGGSIYPANIEIEFDASEHNLKNNTTYSVKLQGYLDWGDGGVSTNEKSTFEFPLTTDFQAPAINGVEYYTEYDKDAKKTRLFAKVAVYDNHYAMAMQVGYISDAPEESEYENIFNTFSNYLTPIYSEKNSTTYVTYELTDYIYEIKNNASSKNTLAISVYDYAMNVGVYEIPLPDEYIDFYFEEEVITLGLYEIYNLTPLVYPNTEWPELLDYRVANENVARVVNNKLIAVGYGNTSVYVKNPSDPTNEVTLRVRVPREGEEGYEKPKTQPVADIFEVAGYETLKAFYRLSSEDKEIGEKGDIRAFDGAPSLSMFPSESVQLRLRLNPYFEELTKVVYISGNDKIVTVDENGVITAVSEGYANVTVRLQLNGKNTSLTKTVRIEVKDPYIRTGPSLTNYYGLGGLVEIPKDMLFTEIGQYAFSNYHYIPKEAYEITEDEPDTTKISYIGEDTITKVIIPEGVEKIGAYAFANLTALEEVVLPKSLKYIEYGAFYGCVNLERVTGLENVVTINKYAFQDCDLRGTISLDSAHAIADYAFASNRNLEGVVISETLRSIGAYAFADNSDLVSVDVKAAKIKLGDYAFAYCTSLEEIEINASVIPTGAFYGSSKLKTVTLGKDVADFSEYAFSGSKISSFIISDGNDSFTVANGGAALLDKSGKTLLLVAPAASGSFTLEGVTSIGDGAFSANNGITSVNMPDVVSVGSYAFSDCTSLSSVTLGALEYIGSYAFSNTPITALPAFADSLTEIGSYAFAYTDVTEVKIPAGMTVGEGAFCECRMLKSVTVGDGAKLGLGAFMLGRETLHPRTGLYNYTYESFTENGKTIYYFNYQSALTSLTVGNNVVIGDSAFLGAAMLISVNMGDEGIVIGDKAFYNTPRLESISFAGVESIGDMAFSGDVIYQYTDPYQQSQYVDENTLEYVYHYYAPAFTSIDLSGVKSIGKEAFRFARNLSLVTLGEDIAVIPYMAFSDCPMLSVINLGNVRVVGESAFADSAITEADLSGAEKVERYAFVNCLSLDRVILSESGTDIDEGAFAYCGELDKLENLKFSEMIGSYAFAYADVRDIDLSCAKSVGEAAFMKDALTEITLTLGKEISYLGDNPFAYCILPTLSSTVTESFGGKDYVTVTYTFDINDNIKVIDGSLYRVVPEGLELIVYVGTGQSSVEIPEGVVRISAMAFAGSDVVRVSLPHSLNAIGHKAFFDCDRLTTVVFKSYDAPILEEEFDQSYFYSYENIPATGDYQFTDYWGNIITHTGLGIVPFYMIDATSYYSSAYYGANFVDYVGHFTPSLVMIAPSNGRYYDSFIYSRYFSMAVDGSVAADDITVEAIEAINRMPNPVQLADEALVVAAREAYNKIATMEQRALVYNYNLLLSAETRINAFKDTGSEDTPPAVSPDLPTDNNQGLVKGLTATVIIESVVILALAIAALWYFLLYRRGINPFRKLFGRKSTEPRESDGTTDPTDNGEA